MKKHMHKIMASGLLSVLLINPLTAVASSSVPDSNPSSIPSSVPVPQPGVPGIVIPDAVGRELGKEEALRIMSETEDNMKKLKNMECSITYDMIMFGSTESITGYAVTEPSSGNGLVSVNVRGRQSDTFYRNGKVYYTAESGDLKVRKGNMEEDLSSVYNLRPGLYKDMKVTELKDGDFMAVSETMSLNDLSSVFPAAGTLKKDVAGMENMDSAAIVTVLTGKDHLIKNMWVELILTPSYSSKTYESIRILCEKEFSRYNSANEITFPSELDSVVE